MIFGRSWTLNELGKPCEVEREQLSERRLKTLWMQVKPELGY